MRRILSLPGLAVTAWASYLALMASLAGMVALMARHPHFLPLTMLLALVIGAGLAVILGASWRIVRGPDRRRALACLLIGAAPLCFLAGHALYGFMIGAGRNFPLSAGLKLLFPLGESLMDLEARFRYPQRTYGEKVVMLSAPMPEAEARAQVAAMDHHIRALEARLGRQTSGTSHWARGPLLGQDSKALLGFCMASQPGSQPTDAEGLSTLDRHEVAHCVMTNYHTPGFDAPAVLSEGWAQANQGSDPIEQAGLTWETIRKGGGMTLRQLTGPEWYDRHEWPAYRDGAPLVNFLLRRFGPEKFLDLYATCRQSTFEDDCRRVLGLDLDGLDAAFRADLENLVTQEGPIARRRLESLRLDPGVDRAAWKAFLAEYFAAAERLMTPYHHVRMISVWTRSETDARGHTEDGRYEETLMRSGEFASLRRRLSRFEHALLAHPRRSILARRSGPDRPWEVEDESKRTPEQSRREALERIDGMDLAGHWGMVPLIGLAEFFALLVSHDHYVVTALERFSDDGRPRVRLRIEDHSPPGWQSQWRARTLILAADDLYVTLSERTEGTGRDNQLSHQTSFTYDRHEGIPVLRRERAETTGADGAHGTSELDVVERRFGPIPEEEFDPDRFLDGTRVTEARRAPPPAEPTILARFYWLPFPIGALGLIAGAALSFGTRPRLGS
jgi:hypothetical protein